MRDMNTTFDYTRIPPLPPSVYVAPLKKPAGVGDDWLEPAQRRYSAEEHRIWDDLYERQMKLMPGHACKEFMHGLDRLNLHRGGVPGLGTSGSGDTLAGVIAGFAARGSDALTAALWGVFVHAAAGKRLAARIGTVGFLAREILPEVPGIVDRLSRGSATDR